MRLEVVVHPPTKLHDALQGKIAAHFELLLTAAGVLLAVVLTVMHMGGSWTPVLTFLVWLQGFLIWAVQRHSRLERARLIRKLRAMLQDRVNNQLTVLVGVAELRGKESGPPGADDVETALTAARSVALELEHMSLESLRVWEDRYGRHLSAPLR